MSDPSRGQYAAERPLAFDGYAPQPRRGGGPAPIALILSLLVLVGAGGGVYYLYRGGLRQPGGPPQPVGAPLGDVRVAAPPQPQAQDPAAGLSIYKDDPNAAAGAPAFVAPPEQPTPRPAARIPEAALAPVPGSKIEAAAKPADAKIATAPGRATSIDRLLAPSEAEPPARPDAVRPAAVKPADGKTGSFSIQIGAFSTEALADKSWNGAAAVAPGDMAGRGKHVAPMTKDDGTMLYRTAITGFASRDEAVALCAKLSAAGKSCFVR